MSWCGSLCDGIEDAADYVEDGISDVVEDIVDSAEDAAAAVVEFVEDVGEFVGETAKDVADFVADVATKAWDWITETADSVWDWVKKTAGEIWEWTRETAEDAWDWVKETTGNAWDWIQNAANRIWDGILYVAGQIERFWTEKVLPFLGDVLWVLSHLDEFILGGFYGLLCLMMGADEREYDVIESMFMLDEDTLAQRKVAFLPQQSKYVVFSDLHLFVHDDPKDVFRKFKNHELYQAVLAVCYAGGFTLVEAGDIEDLWMREENLNEALRETGFDILGFPFGDALEEEYEDYRIRSQAVKIFENNSDIYQTIRTLFHNKGRYVRVIGNHDDVWRQPTYLEGLQHVYPGLVVYDYAFLGDYQAGISAHQGHRPRVIIAHGHQVDPWNTYACRAAGAAMTESAAFFSSVAAGGTERSEWEPKLNGEGFGNVLSDTVTGLDEIEFYELIHKDFRNQPYIPHFIFGHTHAAREDPWLPGYTGNVNLQWIDDGKFVEYSNCGTAGRWQEFLWCNTILNGIAGVEAWTWTPDRKPQAIGFKSNYLGKLVRG